MKSKLSCLLCVAAVALVTFMLWYQPVTAASSLPTSAPTASPTASSDSESQGLKSSTKKWIFFGVTSALSLAVAVPLAIRSGNKKYGK